MYRFGMSNDELFPALASEAAKAMSALGASKGGKARANTMTPEERSEVARNAVRARWAKAGKLKDNPEKTPQTVENEPPGNSIESKVPLGPDPLPFSLFEGILEIGNAKLPCHVLNNGMRVLTHRGMVSSLGMARGGSSKGGGDRLAHFASQERLKPFISKELLSVTTEPPMLFRAPNGQTAYGYEATVLVDLCDVVLRAREAGVLQEQQLHIGRACEALMRSFAKVGIIALIDEATGYQKVRAKHALQLKLQAFIAEELQEWARMFPPEFWYELARLEGIHYSPRNRPLRWGKYVMAFVYDAIDKDVGRELRKKNPNPHFKKNHHQWLKEFGKERLIGQVHSVITSMKLCANMDDFRQKFARVFDKTPLQTSFDDINWSVDAVSLRSSS
jgi:hypothetical protein